QFREDLFYRLNVIPVALPPLRERKEDIPLLVQHFLDRLSREGTASSGREGPTARGARRVERQSVSQDAIRRRMAYQWPGNVRQLENAVERAVAVSGARPQIDVGDLPSEIQETQENVISPIVALPEDGIDLDEFMMNVERELIQRSLERTGGNKGQAAKLLNLKRTTLVEKLKRLEKT